MAEPHEEHGLTTRRCPLPMSRPRVRSDQRR